MMTMRNDNVKKKTFFVYIDRTVDTDEVFYCGKGNDTRIRNLVRNKHHNSISKKHGINREIVAMTSVECLAYDIEIDLISEHHTFVDDPHYNGLGCNYTRGGEGHTPSKAMRDEYSRRMKERWDDSEERTKLSSAMKGKNVGKKKSSIWKTQHSIAMTGINNPNYGLPMPEARKEKLRSTISGRHSPLKGKSVSPVVTAKKMKKIVVTDVFGNTRTFVSRKEAARVIASELQLSHHTLLCYFVSRSPSFHGLTFTYTENKEL